VLEKYELERERVRVDPEMFGMGARDAHPTWLKGRDEF
jgi:hypothetical protein